MHRKNKVVMMMKVQNVNYRPQAYTCVDGGQRQEREAQGHDGSTAHVTTSCKSLHVPGRCGEENVSWTAVWEGRDALDGCEQTEALFASLTLCSLPSPFCRSHTTGTQTQNLTHPSHRTQLQIPTILSSWLLLPPLPARSRLVSH